MGKVCLEILAKLLPSHSSMKMSLEKKLQPITITTKIQLIICYLCFSYLLGLFIFFWIIQISQWSSVFLFTYIYVHYWHSNDTSGLARVQYYTHTVDVITVHHKRQVTSVRLDNNAVWAKIHQVNHGVTNRHRNYYLHIMYMGWKTVHVSCFPACRLRKYV